jgi:hypothetical protein
VFSRRCAWCWSPSAAPTCCSRWTRSRPCSASPSTLVLHYLHLQNQAIPEISTGLSLCVIVVLRAAATAASVIKARKDPTARAHAGRLRERRRDADAPTSDQRK